MEETKHDFQLETYQEQLDYLQQGELLARAYPSSQKAPSYRQYNMRPPTPRASARQSVAYVHSRQKSDSPFWLVDPHAPRSIADNESVNNMSSFKYDANSSQVTHGDTHSNFLLTWDQGMSFERQ